MTDELSSPRMLPEDLRRLLLHIEANLDRNLGIARLARMVGRSYGNFCRYFKRELGQSPHAYIIEQRIQRAELLIRSTAISLTQIALICGFTDQSHLSRWFRTVHGDAPSACRRRWRALACEAPGQADASIPAIEYRGWSSPLAPWCTSTTGLRDDALGGRATPSGCCREPS